MRRLPLARPANIHTCIHIDTARVPQPSRTRPMHATTRLRAFPPIALWHSFVARLTPRVASFDQPR